MHYFLGKWLLFSLSLFINILFNLLCFDLVSDCLSARNAVIFVSQIQKSKQKKMRGGGGGGRKERLKKKKKDKLYTDMD